MLERRQRQRRPGTKHSYRVKEDHEQGGKRCTSPRPSTSRTPSRGCASTRSCDVDNTNESALLWLTRYTQALNDLPPPLPSRVAITGSRAAGFAQRESGDITVAAHAGDRDVLEPRLAEISRPGLDPLFEVLAEVTLGRDP